MSGNLSIPFPKQSGIQAVDDLKTDSETFCDGRFGAKRSSTRVTTVKTTSDPEKASEKGADKEVKEEEESVWKKVGLFALKTAAVTGVVLGGIAVALPVMGFESKGPRGRSLASNYQSRKFGGSTPAGSTFSKMQRAGMVGLSSETIGTVMAGSAAVVAIASAASAFKEKKN